MMFPKPKREDRIKPKRGMKRSRMKGSDAEKRRVVHVTHPCKGCRKPFTTDARYLSRGRNRGRYCSYTCSRRATQRRVTLQCQYCGTTFVVPECRTRTGRGKVCSRACADKLKRTVIEYTCQSCGKIFLGVPSQAVYYRGANQFCSRKCVPKTRGSNKRDERASADRAWSKAIKERDGMICRRCQKFDPSIHAHHIAPRSQRPDLRHSLGNGVCLCASCHTWCHHNPTEAVKLGLLSAEKYERGTT